MDRSVKRMLLGLHVLLLGGFTAWLTTGTVSSVAYVLMLVGFGIGVWGYLRGE
ncbi:MAG: hypothetical protein LC737_11580 [Chloroflexi bacterium]|nr:hypothetical protein [Chloroflexota bacterium]